MNGPCNINAKYGGEDGQDGEDCFPEDDLDMILAAMDDNILENLQKIDVEASVVAQDIPNSDSTAVFHVKYVLPNLA